MFSPLLDKAAYGALTLLLGLLAKELYRRIRPWIKTRAEMAEMDKDKAAVRRQTAKYFSAFLLVCSAAFGLLILLAITFPETSQATPILRALAGAVAGLGVVGALLLVIFLPSYNSLVGLEERLQHLEERYPSSYHRDLILEYRCRSLEDQNQKLEERMKALESQGQSQNKRLDEQLPLQRNLAFMDMYSVKKRDQDTDLMKHAKADGSRRAGSQS